MEHKKLLMLAVKKQYFIVPLSFLARWHVRQMDFRVRRLSWSNTVKLGSGSFSRRLELKLRNDTLCLRSSSEAGCIKGV